MKSYNSNIFYKSKNNKLKKNIEPERLSRPSDPYFIALTIFSAWILSLSGYEKLFFNIDILLLILVFWCIYERFQIGLCLSFVFGILVDVHSTEILGKNAIFYIFTIYFITSLKSRILRFDLYGQTFHMVSIFLIAKFISQSVEAWLYGYWLGWKWSIGPILTALLWPVICWFLLLLQKYTNNKHVN
ncbi:hypothetical protein CKSOR_00634 [Candidatus Kinetoplastibacterium sorsogonicusi]|uniref:Uncharacterized protein n=1 Tax=Candidatus Kinetoplastidibacterium kentomonadis TaxID=1576550 RepID=A0A3S7JAP1_9PROT|nr:rod shape-determining protein MreD [Candidatus Kinetoplastibacterium sorsogonicusi]AWD32735.1 hypothetical protein CKSOR_00634 [Candidatus Kinetoplastibacterium sorsogonicusi]